MTNEEQKMKMASLFLQSPKFQFEYKLDNSSPTGIYQIVATLENNELNRLDGVIMLLKNYPKNSSELKHNISVHIRIDNNVTFEHYQLIEQFGKHILYGGIFPPTPRCEIRQMEQEQDFIFLFTDTKNHNENKLYLTKKITDIKITYEVYEKIRDTKISLF